MLKHIILTLSIITTTSSHVEGQYTHNIALLKYNGGGDWYANPTALPNLVTYSNQKTGTTINPEYDIVDVGSIEIFNYPLVHMTGHGNVIFSNEDAKNLRTYLMAGGFLHIDDNYGMDKFIRPELKKIFPDQQLHPIPPDHPIFRQFFNFPDGLPKIHEHDNKPPEALGIFIKGRLVLLYTHESDLSDGWEDAEVHNDPTEVREKALKMGGNILQYVLDGEAQP